MRADEPYDLDLGSEHFLRFVGWYPDDLPANRARYSVPEGEPMPALDKVGASIRHRRADNGEWCISGLTFDIDGARHLADDDHRWAVNSWEPLTLEPSVLCRLCGDHGYVRAEQWEAA